MIPELLISCLEKIIVNCYLSFLCPLLQVGDPDPHLVFGCWTEVGPRGY